MGTSAHWDQTRVLVTGASGFIGRYLVRRLKELNAQIYATRSPVSRSARRQTPDHESTTSSRDACRIPQALTFDIRDPEAVQNAIHQSRPDIVFHLAAVGTRNPRVEPMSALMVNAGGAINLLEALRETGPDRVVLAGTSYEYGASGATKRLDPFNTYSASKVAAWAFGRVYWRAYDLPVVIVRPFQVYGPGQPDQTLIPSAIRSALAGADFPMTPGEQRRDFIFAKDVADGMIAAAETRGIEGKSLDLGTGIGTTVRRVVERIWSLTDARGSIQLGALPYRSSKAMHLIANAGRTARLTGWHASTSLDDGLRRTIRSQTLRR